MLFSKSLKRFTPGLPEHVVRYVVLLLTRKSWLSTKNAKLANSALDFLVDMFNDEIESVRLKAIEALTLTADHICLQAHQLETILWALDDCSFIVREKLHEMLQASNIATKDGLQNVIGKLLENLNGVKILHFTQQVKRTSFSKMKIEKSQKEVSFL